MTQTEKFPVFFDPSRKDDASRDFLIPFRNGKKIVFHGLESGHERELGLIAYIGKSIIANDVFARLVDSGSKINDVDDAFWLIERYVERLQSFKVGNIIRLNYSEAKDDFEIELVANSSRSFYE